MCGRYFFEVDDKDLREIVTAAEQSIRKKSVTNGFHGGEIFPGGIAPVLTAEADASFMVWGFPSLFEKRPHINARSETAATAPTFREAMSKRRCLVPASGYYEWKKLGPSQRKKYSFTLPNYVLLFMAGIYAEDGRFAILTRAASSSVSEIHNRMPVIIPREMAAAWLEDSPEALGAAITDLVAIPVSPAADQGEQISFF